MVGSEFILNIIDVKVENLKAEKDYEVFVKMNSNKTKLETKSHKVANEIAI